MDIKNLFYDKREVGRTVKGSKLYFIWEFCFYGKVIKIEIFHSVYSGKKTLVINGKVMVNDENYSNDFTHTFKVKTSEINITQISKDRFDVKIDNRPFNLLMNDETSGTYSIVKKENYTAVDELCGGLYEKKEISKENTKSTHRTEIPNFFNDNDFDFVPNEKIETKSFKEVVKENKQQQQPISNKVNSNIDLFDLFGSDSNEKKNEDSKNNVNENNIFQNTIDFTGQFKKSETSNSTQNVNSSNTNINKQRSQSQNLNQIGGGFNNNQNNYNPNFNPLINNGMMQNYMMNNPQINNIMFNPHYQQPQYNQMWGGNPIINYNNPNDLSFLYDVKKKA